MVRRAARIPLVLALLLCLFLPTAAWAAEEDDRFASFAVQATNGYRIIVFAWEEPGEPGRATLFAMHRSRERAAIYQARATVTHSGLWADFGAVGRISLAFAASSERGSGRASCGIRVSFDKGTYSGIFEFHGEQGFTQASARRIPSNPLLLVNFAYCNGSVDVDVADPGQPGAGALFRALARRGERSALFVEAVKNRPDGRALVRASLREHRHGLSIVRSAGMFADAPAFDYDPALRTATLDPPAPFSGSARYRRDAGPDARWSGNLRVDLPGRANVSLTRPELRPKLGRGNWRLEDGAFGRPLALLEAP